MKDCNINYAGATAVLENYLDGAVADYENGEVDNVEMIMSSICALKKLGDASWKQYLKRMNKENKDETLAL